MRFAIIRASYLSSPFRVRPLLCRRAERTKKKRASRMTQTLTERDVRDIATYARIGLTDDELSQMTLDLNNIIETLAPITEFDLEGVEPTFHPIGSLSNVMRDDVEAPSFTQSQALMNAPKQQDGSFLIPAILGGGDQ